MNQREQGSDARHLELILDSVTDGIIGTDLDGLITFANRAATRLLDATEEELTGARVQEVLREPRDASGARASLAEVLTRTRFQGEAELPVQGDAEPRSVAFNSTPVHENGETRGAVITLQDVTSKQQAEREAQQALRQLMQERVARAEAESMQAQLNRIFGQVPAAVAVTIGPEHRFDLANAEYLQTVGRSEIVGRTIREAFPELIGDPVLDLLDRAFQTGEPASGTEVPLHLVIDGEPRLKYYNFVYQPLFDYENRVTGIMVHAVEVTEQVINRRNVEEKAEQLSRLTRELERSNRELDQFAYVTSHDLKAPLRGIANLAQWIEEDLDEKLTDESREHLRLLGVRVHRMEALIDGILQFSRAGRVRARPERLDMVELITDVVDFLAPPEEVTVEVDPDLPTVVAERLPLEQVFQNLIGNALKHGHGPDARVRITGRVEGNNAVFAVSDNGPGIAADYHDRIWGIFQTLAARDKVEGTGIGLALVKKIIDARGGRVWVESEAGAGATFYIELPRQSEEPR